MHLLSHLALISCQTNPAKANDYLSCQTGWSPNYTLQKPIGRVARRLWSIPSLSATIASATTMCDDHANQPTMMNQPSKRYRVSHPAGSSPNSHQDNGKQLNEFRYLEFYAGVGGWRMALDEALQVPQSHRLDSHVRCVGALEHSDLCLQVYRHNFQRTESSDETTATTTGKTTTTKKVKPKQTAVGMACCRIELITAEQLTQQWRADAWFMSPPCQPHTRQHDKQSDDLTDPRSSSFLHLCHLLEHALPDDALPTLLCLENVVNFAESNSSQIWRRALAKRNYQVAHFHWNPTQVNLPNDRPRYFCLAVLQDKLVTSSDANACWEGILRSEKNVLDQPPLIQTSLSAFGVIETDQINTKQLPCIRQFLDSSSSNSSPQKNAAVEHTLVPDRLLDRNASWCFDIVTKDSQRSACFTSGYGKFVKGTGSVIYMGERDKDGSTDTVEATTGSIRDSEELFALEDPEDRVFDPDWRQKLGTGKLRYFSGSEIARLMGFAPSFSFPSTCSPKQQWKLVGNSLNVRLASRLVRFGLCLCGKISPLPDESSTIIDGDKSIVDQ